LALAAVVGGAAFAGGCNRGAKTPGEAWQRFVASVKQKDPRALYQALDLETRWSWMTTRRTQREAHDIVLSNFPEGTSRDQHLRRFEAAAAADSEADLFASWLPASRWESLAGGLPESATPEQRGADRAEVLGAEGQVWSLRKDRDGNWGFSGFSEEAEVIKRRALADLEVVRNNAADLERAATRAGK
jgi:hypothetical protein